MNDISFTSRIRFVDRKVFDKFCQKGIYVDFRPDNDMSALDMMMLKPSKNIVHPRLDVLKADEFYTDTVRTCTAGGVVDTKTGEAVGFHIFDSLDNLEKTDDILENIFGRVKNPDRAVILGSKGLKIACESIPIFQKLYEGISKRVKNVTIFREHLFPFSESDMHYCAKTDTWTIRSMYRPITDFREHNIKSKDELEKCFREVKLADGDTLEFGAE